MRLRSGRRRRRWKRRKKRRRRRPQRFTGPCNGSCVGETVPGTDTAEAAVVRKNEGSNFPTGLRAFGLLGSRCQRKNSR